MSRPTRFFRPEALLNRIYDLRLPQDRCKVPAFNGLAQQRQGLSVRNYDPLGLPDQKRWCGN